MKINNLWLAFLAALLFSACSENKTKPGDAVFTGTIKGAENRPIYVRNDPTTLEIDTLMVGPDGSFIFTKYLEKPGYFDVFMGRSNLSVYLKPNDTLRFTTDLSQGIGQGKFSGGGVVYNNYLMDLTRQESDLSKQMDIVFRQDEKKALAFMDSARTLLSNKLHSLKESYPKIDPLFMDKEKQRIKYFYALLHLMYPQYYRYYNHDDQFKTSPGYDSYLGEMDLNNPDLVSLMEYRQFANSYLNDQVNSWWEDSTLQEQQPSFTAYQLETLDKVFKQGKLKDIMAYKIMSDHITYDGVKNYDVLKPLFEKVCSSEVLKQAIAKDLDAWKYLLPGKPARDFAGVTMNGDSVHLSDFKGKYVYVDVWATWCRPCLGEIPYLEKVEKALEGKNIVFISISVDRDKTAWETMMKEGEHHGVQLYTGNNPDLSEYYKISGIPRFMLFDRESNILEVSADRPSAGVEKKLFALEGI